MPSCVNNLLPVTGSCASEEDVIAHIIRTFGAGSSCENQLEEVIEVFWQLAGIEACFSLNLRTLITRREAVLFLMGCEAFSVDTFDQHYEMHDVRKSDTTSDTNSQAQSTRNSTSFSAGTGSTRYDESSYARSTGTMDRTLRGSEQGDGSSSYRDDGRGDGFNNSFSTNSIISDDDSFDNKHTNVDATVDAARGDCNYEYSQNNTEGLGFAVPLAGASFTSTGSDWRKFTSSGSTEQDSSRTLTTHTGTRTLDDVRTGQGTHDWLNRFQADVFWVDRDTDLRISRDRTDSRRHSEAQAHGDGDGMSEEKVTGHSAAQGTALTITETHTKGSHNRVWNRTAVGLTNSQKFRNLRLIYDQLTERIELEKRRLRNRATPAICQLPCYCTGACQCGPSLLSPRCREIYQMGIYAATHY